MWFVLNRMTPHFYNMIYANKHPGEGRKIPQWRCILPLALCINSVLQDHITIFKQFIHDLRCNLHHQRFAAAQ